MSAYIILQNVPQELVRIDLSSYQVPEEFMGFWDVPPGLHYVSITTQNHTHSFWCYIRSEQILVKFFSQINQEFRDREPQVATDYEKQLALGLLTEEELIRYNYK